MLAAALHDGAGASMLGKFLQARAPVAAADPGTADEVVRLLGELTVIDALGRHGGYDRSCAPGRGCSFGVSWNDPDDHSGCSTRNRVLAADMREVVFKPHTHNCKVLSGVLDDPYTGQSITFTRDDPRAVEVDHIAAVHRVWNAGAYQWSQERRVRFANDTTNLQAVDGPTNEAKGDAGLEWLPPNRAYVCEYSRRYLAVFASYRLPITVSDRVAALRACNR